MSRNQHDPEALKELLAKTGEINNFDLPRPLVSLEDFFLGNNDFGSIGYNMYPDQPSPAEFFDKLREVRSLATVKTVLVQIQQHEDPDGWPSTDTVWVITTESSETVSVLLGDRFAPDDIFESLPDYVQKYDVPEGYRALGVWYD